MALLIDDLFNFRVTLAQGLKIAHNSLVFKIMNVQSMKGLSRYEGFVKIWRVCQNMKGLSKYEEFVN